MLYSYVNEGITGIIGAIDDSGEDVNVFAIIFPRCAEFPQIVGTSVLNAGGARAVDGARLR